MSRCFNFDFGQSTGTAGSPCQSVCQPEEETRRTRSAQQCVFGLLIAFGFTIQKHLRTYHSVLGPRLSFLLCLLLQRYFSAEFTYAQP